MQKNLVFYFQWFLNAVICMYTLFIFECTIINASRSTTLSKIVELFKTKRKKFIHIYIFFLFVWKVNCKHLTKAMNMDQNEDGILLLKS